MDQLFMQRAIDLAKLGAGKVSPNPMVGAVVVYENRIIGEGFHAAYGTAHAEVMAINSIKDTDRPLLRKSTLYVSLEPCCVYGNTPPCTNLIIEKKIPKVIIAHLDFSPDVNGKGVEILRKNGVEVITEVLKNESYPISKFRNTYVSKKRPYVILKFAKSLNNKIGVEGKQVWITNSYSKRLVHKWRSETDAIMVGTNTVRTDNPRLTNRFFTGSSPIRITFDKHLQLDPDLHLFDEEAPTIVFSASTSRVKKNNNVYHELNYSNNTLPQVLEQLYKKGITSLMVEGGGRLLSSFTASGLWDEARVLIGNKAIQEGIEAPRINEKPSANYRIGTDLLLIYYAD